MEQGYDQRQYESMLKFLSDFKERKIDLGVLIKNLEALRDVLENPSNSWLEKFDTNWGKLEDVYAFMLMEQRRDFDDIDNNLIETALGNLIQLVKENIS